MEEPRDSPINAEDAQKANTKATADSEKVTDQVGGSDSAAEHVKKEAPNSAPEVSSDNDAGSKPGKEEEEEDHDQSTDASTTPAVKVKEESTEPSSKSEDRASEPSKETIEALKSKPTDELTQLERAQLAASKAKISTLPELDPITPPENGAGLPKHQHRYALSAIRAIKRLKDAGPFVAPVDPIRQGVPQYFEYIKHPMDLGTMEKKLVEQSYDTIKAFIDDFNLIITNCIVFNGEDALISQMALAISQSFKKQLSNMPTYDATRKGAQALAAADASSGAAGSGSATPGVSATATSGANATSATGGANGAGASTASSWASGSAIDDAHDAENAPKRGGSVTTTVVGPNGVPTLRRKSTIDGRPKREIRPPRQPGTFFGSGSGQGRPRNKKYASELRFAGQVLKEMQGRKLESISWPFLAPVDPVEQGVPTYFEVIKEPMDLSTIQRKLMDGIYYTGEEFESDIRLMFRNCYTFNPEGTPVNVLGHKLEEYFDGRWMDKPIPGAHHSAEDSDMSDVDDEYAESGLASPAIDVLEEQKRMINKQLKRLKKEALADYYKRGSKGSRSSAPKRRRSSNANVTHGGSHSGGHGNSHGSVSGGSTSTSSNNHTSSTSSNSKALPTEMTYEMKRQIHDQMENLSQQQIATVISIIQESMPEMRGQDEIELEVDALDTQTQLRIYNYAVLNRTDKPRSSHDDDGDHYTRKKKSKALSEEEHEQKVAEINRKIKEFKEAQSSGTPSASATAASTPTSLAAGSENGAGSVAAESSDDDDDMSDSSSEEE